MRADIVPGARFPDYELTDHTRTRRRLSELQGNDPMILILSRGHYCPKDHQQHLELATFYPKIAVAYTKIVTISTDNILETNEFRDAVGAQWTFLSDSGRKIQQDLDIQEYTDPHHNPMIRHWWHNERFLAGHSDMLLPRSLFPVWKIFGVLAGNLPYGHRI